MHFGSSPAGVLNTKGAATFERISKPNDHHRDARGTEKATTTSKFQPQKTWKKATARIKTPPHRTFCCLQASPRGQATEHRRKLEICSQHWEAGMKMRGHKRNATCSGSTFAEKSAG